MRTIKKRWSRNSMGDVQKMCDICGVVWNRSKMIKDADGSWRCPDDMKGRSFKEISEGIARRARNLHKRKTIEAYGRLDTTCKGYSTNPQEIMGNLLLGWWNFDAVSVGRSCDRYDTPLPYLSASVELFTQAYFMLLSGYSVAEAQAWISGMNAPTTEITERSGILNMRNRAKRYDHDTIESTVQDQIKFGELVGDTLTAPIYDPDSHSLVFEMYAEKAFRRLVTPRGNKLIGQGDYPCVWVVCKPSGNNVISSVNPGDHGDYANIVSFQREYSQNTGDSDDVFCLPDLLGV